MFLPVPPLLDVSPTEKKKNQRRRMMRVRRKLLSVLDLKLKLNCLRVHFLICWMFLRIRILTPVPWILRIFAMLILILMTATRTIQERIHMSWWISGFQCPRV
jgi:hypothetical protein